MLRPMPKLTASEIITLLVYYHRSGYKNLQYYYQRLVLPQLGRYFPDRVSYGRFIELLPRQAPTLHVLTNYLCLANKRTGCYFANSKKLPVCDNKRIHNHKVFAAVAGRGKSSTGWFLDLIFHLIINELSQLMAFLITPANVADNTDEVHWVVYKGAVMRIKGI